jgi:hypothetical protein
MPAGPGKAGEMLYRYRLYSTDGSFEGEAHYAVPIEPGETIWSDGRKLLVVGVVSVPDGHSPYMGLLAVEEASPVSE